MRFRVDATIGIEARAVVREEARSIGADGGGRRTRAAEWRVAEWRAEEARWMWTVSHTAVATTPSSPPSVSFRSGTSGRSDTSSGRRFLVVELP
jgi:hypothetical protein